MSKEEWFRNYESLLNEGHPDNDATVERARQHQVDRLYDRADERKKRERGE